MLRKINCIINGKKKSIEIDVRQSLLEMLRDTLKLKGTKAGCHVGECGACTVLINGKPINSCIYLAVWADQKEIKTIEGIGDYDRLSKVQKAFVQEGAIQCGFCTPGLVVTASHLKDQNTKFEPDIIKRELSGHLCRCTGYKKILSAVQKALS